MVGDSRISLFLCIISGALAWQLGLFPLLVLLPVLLLVYNIKRQENSVKPLISLMIFVSIWGLFIFLLKCIEIRHTFTAEEVQGEFLFAFSFSLRLFSAGCIGLLVPLIIPFKECACVITWVLKPFFPKSAWKAGLLALLVLRLIPIFFSTGKNLQKSIQYRFAGVPYSGLKQVKLFAVNFIKNIALQNNALAVALLSRGLYNPQVFEKKWDKLNLATLTGNKWEVVLALFVIVLFIISSIYR